MFRTRVTVRDAIAVAVVLFAACLLLWAPWQSRADGAFLVITTPDGTSEYALSENREIEINSQGIVLIAVIENGAAYVRESDCPDGVCRVGGRIFKSGESILCAPAGIRLSIKGGDGNVDYVAG
ncbi:MAG: NusG domain II-containing protein [Clostridia bacterium]|nr:NusG domain II-containing protein [Clostridia bacterium]